MLPTPPLRRCFSENWGGTRRKKRVSNKKGGNSPPAPDPVIEYVMVPKHWFSDPLHQAMAALVRPPTKNTRRKELKIELRIPEQVFIDLLKPLETGDMADLKWTDESKSALEPTSSKKTYDLYKYIATKPSLMDKIWRLEDYDKERKRGKKKDGVELPFRRGHGAAKLHLSAAAARRGARASLVSQVTGSTVLKLKVPKRERAMPTLTIIFAVSTMDANGNIEWAKEYAPKTAAALRKQIRYHLTEMIADPEYPTLEHMASGLTGGAEAVWTPPLPPAQVSSD